MVPAGSRGGRIRTADHRVPNAVRYQLRYTPEEHEYNAKLASTSSRMMVLSAAFLKSERLGACLHLKSLA